MKTKINLQIVCWITNAESGSIFCSTIGIITVATDQTADNTGIFTKSDSLILNFLFIPHNGIENRSDKIPRGINQYITASDK